MEVGRVPCTGPLSVIMLLTVTDIQGSGMDPVTGAAVHSVQETLGVLS